MQNVKQIGTDELTAFNENGTGTILDVRPIAAFNGWKLKDEARGGHIPGAKNIPLQWTSYMDWVEVLEEKNVSSDKPVIVYGYDEDSSKQMAKQLSDLGYNEIWLYNGFIDEWSGNNERPLEKLEKYEQLVHPEWVHQLLNGGNPPHFDGEDYVVCHSHYDYIEDYQKGHIPGAVALNSNLLESTETWNRRSPDELKSALEQLGIDCNTTVVLYGRFSAPVYDEEKFPGKSAGHLGSIRCAAIMLYAGVKDVKILNGGITSWEQAGYELATEETKPTPVKDFGVSIPVHPEFMIDTDEAKEYIASEDAELVSIRSWEEFIGKRSGYHYIEQKGRIPGAVFGNCGSDAYHMENYRNFDHTIRQADEVAEKWMQEQLTPDKKLAFYCGTGWRGSEAFFNAYLMGYPRVSVYDGGWFEWCSNPDNPIAAGNPEEKYSK